MVQQVQWIRLNDFIALLSSRKKKKLTSERQGAIVSKTPAVATCDLRKSFRYVTWHLGLFPIAPGREKKKKEKVLNQEPL